MPFAPKPGFGENVRGYVRRLAQANSHRSLTTFLEAVGLVAIGPLKGSVTWDRLRGATGLAEGLLAPMRWHASRSAAGNRVGVLGHQLAPGHVHAKGVRLCPACLAEDGLRRDFWCLSMVTACPRHTTLLAESCSNCGHPFSPGLEGRPDTCRCGHPYHCVAVKPAPISAVRAARQLAILVGQEAAAAGAPVEPPDPPFDPVFALLNAHDFLCCLGVLGTAAMTPAGDDPPATGASRNYYRSGRDQQPPVATTLATLKAADRIMSDWPAAFEALLDEVTDRGCGGKPGRSMDRAYSTRVGKMLRFPPRGSDGLPLRLIHVAVDAHWRDRGGKSRARNHTVFDATARELHSVVSAAWLAAAAGDGKATAFHSKVIKRAFELLTEDERSMPRDRLAAIVRARATALHAAVSASLSPVQVKQRVEGTKDHNQLSGWDHAELLRPDPTLQGLQRGDKVYAAEATERVLARIRQLAVQVTEQGSMVPLVSVGMRVLLKEPRPSKTDILLRIFRGQLAVATLVDSPSLGDLLVDPVELNRGTAAARAMARGPLLSEADLNALVLERYGPDHVLSFGQLIRLSRGGLVRTDTRERYPGTRKPESMTVFNSEDIEGIVSRRRAGRPSLAETAAFGVEVDVGPLIARLHVEGRSPPAIAAELAARGLMTVHGSAWRGDAIATLLRAGGEQPVLAVRAPGTGTTQPDGSTAAAGPPP